MTTNPSSSHLELGKELIEGLSKEINQMQVTGILYIS